MEFLWIVLTLAAAAILGWPVTAAVLRLARAVENLPQLPDPEDSGTGVILLPQRKEPCPPVSVGEGFQPSRRVFRTTMG